MIGSALWGQPPNNERDYKIVRGLLFSYGFPESTDPAFGVPTRQHAPPGYRFETRGPGVIGGLVVAILLSFLITGTRLLLRGCRKDLRWGLDDWVIIPAVVGLSVRRFVLPSSQLISVCSLVRWGGWAARSQWSHTGVWGSTYGMSAMKNCTGSFEYVRTSAPMCIVSTALLTDSQPIVSRGFRSSFLLHGSHDQNLNHFVQPTSHWLDLSKMDDGALYLPFPSGLLHHHCVVP